MASPAGKSVDDEFVHPQIEGWVPHVTDCAPESLHEVSPRRLLHRDHGSTVLFLRLPVGRLPTVAAAPRPAPPPAERPTADTARAAFGWPLDPRPRVGRGFDPPAETGCPGTGASTWRRSRASRC